MVAITICSDFGAQKNKVWHCFHCFPIYLPWSDGTRCHDLSFLNAELYAKFLTLLFHFLESPLDYKEIQPIHPKGDQSWIFIERTDAEAGTPILWPPDVKSELIGKDPDAGKDWRQEEKGMTEDDMVGWHHRLNGHESEQTLGVAEGQGSLVCCSPRGHKESDTTETELNWRLCNYPLLLLDFGLELDSYSIKYCWMKGKKNNWRKIEEFKKENESKREREKKEQ